MDWQPIETAPKDGTRVLLVEAEQPTGVSTGWWTMAGWRDFGDIGCSGLADYSPTHWMPLPAPPRALSEHPITTQTHTERGDRQHREWTHQSAAARH